MTVDEMDKVDIISIDPKGRVVLSVADHLPWDDPEHILILQEKLNKYLAFIDSGELIDKYPDAKGRNTMIEIHFKFPPDGTAMHFIHHFKEFIEDLGIDFSIQVGEEKQKEP